MANLPIVIAQADPIRIDLGGIGEALGQWLLAHLGDFGAAIWTGLQEHMGEIGAVVWAALTTWLITGIQASAEALWLNVWGSGANLITQLPAELTYNFPPYKALVDANPVVLITGGATLALVMLGLRVSLSATMGADHVVTHIATRLIPAVVLAGMYPVIIVRGTQLLNEAATGLGAAVIGGGVVAGLKTALLLPLTALTGIGLVLVIPLLILWGFMLWYGVKLIVRLGYSLFRFLIALLFGPLAIVLWAIPQTEWITIFWLHELLGWGTAPLLVTACLAMVIPLATAQSGGFIAAFVFGIAGLQAAHDLIGVFSQSGGRGGGGPFSVATVGGVARSGVAAAGTGGAAVAMSAAEVGELADKYGYN